MTVDSIFWRSPTTRSRRSIKGHIAQHVQQVAPDIDVEDFWTVAPRVQRETPAHLRTVGERLEWQTRRAVQIVREQYQRVRQRAGVAPTAGAAGAGQVPGIGGNLVEQMRARRVKYAP